MQKCQPKEQYYSVEEDYKFKEDYKDDYYYNKGSSMQMKASHSVSPPKHKYERCEDDYKFKEDFNYDKSSSMRLKASHSPSPPKHNYNHREEEYKFKEDFHFNGSRPGQCSPPKHNHNKTHAYGGHEGYNSSQYSETCYEKEQHYGDKAPKGYPGSGHHKVGMGGGYGARRGPGQQMEERHVYYSEQRKELPAWASKGVVD